MKGWLLKLINVIGLGYIGLPTALALATAGNEVVGTDYNRDLIETLSMGRTTFEENGLDTLFETALLKGIKFTNEYISTDFYIITVPTPYEKHNKKVDPSFILSATIEVLNVCKKGTILVIESTVSPGTIERYVRPLIKEKGFLIGEDIHLVHAPERIIPGNMINELMTNSRTIGADSPEIGEKVKSVYSTFCTGEIIVTDIRTAEMTKVVENAYRDVNIAFANELAKICRSDEMDVYKIIQIANKHPRVNILSPGPGVGGHCISVDPWFLVGDYPGLANLILTARKINDSMPEFVLERISDIMIERDIRDITRIGLYGLTYKEDIDDTRESPTIQLVENMRLHLASGIKTYDPYINNKVLENQYFDFDEFLNSVDIVVIMVAHSHIKQNLSKLHDKIILDTKNIVSFENVYKL